MSIVNNYGDLVVPQRQRQTVQEDKKTILGVCLSVVYLTTASSLYHVGSSDGIIGEQ